MSAPTALPACWRRSAAVMVSMTLGIESDLLLTGAGYIALPLLARAIREPCGRAGRRTARRRPRPGPRTPLEPAPLVGDTVAAIKLKAPHR